MGSFWGMSDRGKTAQGVMGDIGNMDMQQYRDWLARQSGWRASRIVTTN
jgi:hypothetical protein